jgi:hypothetical protein
MPETTFAVDPRAQASSPISVYTLSGATSATPGVRHQGRRMPASIPSGQRYFWSRLWQEGERETDQDVARGDVHRFQGADDAIRWLLSSDD